MWINTNRQTLIEFRIREGLSQRQLAEKAKCSDVMVCQIESGARNPSPNMAKRICEALGVNFSAIFAIMEENFFTESARNCGETPHKSTSQAS